LVSAHAWLKPGERLDDLMRGKMHIIQDPGLFCFGTDAVLLAHFAAVKPGERVCDLGSGTGILPLLIAAREPDARIDAVELQPPLCDILRRNIRMNGLDKRILPHEMDLRDAPARLGTQKYDCVVCNPPYFKPNANLGSAREEVRIARQEIACTLDDIFRAASLLLVHGGRLCIVHQTARSADVITGMRAHALEPKTVRAVHYDARQSAKLALWEARKGGGESLAWLKPLLLRGSDGKETLEMMNIYHGSSQ
jgi:tRNA1Val (adenine37-N6)-methyltransferase